MQQQLKSMSSRRKPGSGLTARRQNNGRFEALHSVQDSPFPMLWTYRPARRKKRELRQKAGRPHLVLTRRPATACLAQTRALVSPI